MRIGDAAAIAAELRVAHVPPLALIEKDIERVQGELASLLERARAVALELEAAEDTEAGPAQARRLIAGARLNEIRQLLSLSHCALIPHEDPRKAASRRTADYIRKKSPPLVLPPPSPGTRGMSAAGIDAAFLQAWELRGTPYLRDAVSALTGRYERVPLTLAEESAEQAARVAHLVQLLRETDPGLRRPRGSHGNATPVDRSMPRVGPAAPETACGPRGSQDGSAKAGHNLSQGSTDVVEDLAA